MSTLPTKVLHVVGARPNFPKTAPIMAAMAAFPDIFEQVLIHTGQHYDHNMSQVFFDDLDMPEPDEFLEVGSGTHAVQTARVMQAFEPTLLRHRPDWVFVVGDVNSTLACALVCSKLGIPVAHVEAGLRSGDRSMPEEINRLLTDQISDLLFTPTLDSNTNLEREGIAAEKIHFVGNVMIDTLIRCLPKARSRPVVTTLGLRRRDYVLATFHRPSNVDEPAALAEVLGALTEIARTLPVVFPLHPRTRTRIVEAGLDSGGAGLRLIEPLGYLDFAALMEAARVVLTDSGGVQEETTFLGVPCLTARASTERPVTIAEGTNRLVSTRRELLVQAVREAVDATLPQSRLPALWDGQAAQRITATMIEVLRPRTDSN